MTREEAINDLKDFIDTYLTCHGEEDTIAVSLNNVDVEAFHMAIKALKQEPCEDAVSRKAVLDMATVIETDDYSGNEIMKVVDTEDIKALPSVTPAPKKLKRAHWIDNHNGTISCSYCHVWFYKDDRYSYMRYCPYCNKKMAESEG